MSKRQSANGTQSPMRGTPPLQTVKISYIFTLIIAIKKHMPIT